MLFIELIKILKLIHNSLIIFPQKNIKNSNVVLFGKIGEHHFDYVKKR